MSYQAIPTDEPSPATPAPLFNLLESVPSSAKLIDIPAELCTFSWTKPEGGETLYGLASIQSSKSVRLFVFSKRASIPSGKTDNRFHLHQATVNAVLNVFPTLIKNTMSFQIPAVHSVEGSMVSETVWISVGDTEWNELVYNRKLSQIRVQGMEIPANKRSSWNSSFDFQGLTFLFFSW